MTDTAVGGLESAARPEPAPPDTRPARFPCFDGFRAVAALTVVVTHTSFTTQLNDIPVVGVFTARMDIGVAIFFLISGFLLYRPFALAHLTSSPHPATGRYLWRRFVRIFPAYWVACLFAFYVFDVNQPKGADALVYFFLLQIYVPKHAIGGITQAWTLATEISFYLFLPVWAWAVRRAARRSSRPVTVEVIGLALLVVVAAAFKWWVLVTHPDKWGDYGTWLPAYLDHFALGMLLAVLSARKQARPTSSAGLFDRRFSAGASWLVAAAIFWWVSVHGGLGLNPFATPPTRAEWMIRHYTYAAVAFCFLLPGIFGRQDRGLVRRFLRLRTVQWLGLISYGVYLWHNAWLDTFYRWTGRPLFSGGFLEVLGFVIAATVATSAVTYYLVEKPALRLKR